MNIDVKLSFTGTFYRTFINGPIHYIQKSDKISPDKVFSICEYLSTLPTEERHPNEIWNWLLTTGKLETGIARYEFYGTWAPTSGASYDTWSYIPTRYKVPHGRGPYSKMLDAFEKTPKQIEACRAIIRKSEKLGELETELTNWVPIDSKESPNRLDALVWGLTYCSIFLDPVS